MNRIAEAVLNRVDSVIKGKDDVVLKVFAAMIAGGHILMEDIPGVGKTTLAKAFARTLSLDYRRVQFTPDVLPSDILGFSMYEKESGRFEFHPGPVFSNLFLADEINRTSPKTQSALLEVMEEGTATVDGVTRELPDPFIVIATENPYGSSGTQMLPESQLDRFMICLSMGYPAHEDAVAILKGNAAKPVENIKPVLTADDLKTIRTAISQMYVKDEIYDYIVSLVEHTRNGGSFAQGASPRGTIAMLGMAKSVAFINDRDYVTAEDVQSIARDTLGHRVKLSARAKAAGITMDDAIQKLIEDVRAPRT